MIARYAFVLAKHISRSGNEDETDNPGYLQRRHCSHNRSGPIL